MTQSHRYFIALCYSRQSRRIISGFFIIKKLEHIYLFLSRLVTVTDISMSLHIPLSCAVRVLHALRLGSAACLSLKKPDKQPSSS